MFAIQINSVFHCDLFTVIYSLGQYVFIQYCRGLSSPISTPQTTHKFLISTIFSVSVVLLDLSVKPDIFGHELLRLIVFFITFDVSALTE